MNIFAKPGTSFHADGLEREQAMDDQNDQASVLIDIKWIAPIPMYQHDNKMSMAINDLKGAFHKPTPPFLNSILDEIDILGGPGATELE